jgi:protein SCO1
VRTRLALVLLGLALVTSGCASGKAATSADALRGTRIAAPITMPALTLTDQHGASYDLRARTAGRVTLMYFGYTHCPDECPAMMADLALTMRHLPAQVRSHVTVVDITPDPARDTPAVMKAWLDQFDPTFIGLTGNLDTIEAFAAKVRIPLKRPQVGAKGNYTVVHGTQLLAFGTDQKAHVVYADGTETSVYEHDFPLLAQGDA